MTQLPIGFKKHTFSRIDSNYNAYYNLKRCPILLSLLIFTLCYEFPSFFLSVKWSTKALTVGDFEQTCMCGAVGGGEAQKYDDGPTWKYSAWPRNGKHAKNTQKNDLFLNYISWFTSNRRIFFHGLNHLGHAGISRLYSKKKRTPDAIKKRKNILLGLD